VVPPAGSAPGRPGHPGSDRPPPAPCRGRHPAALSARYRAPAARLTGDVRALRHPAGSQPPAPRSLWSGGAVLFPVLAETQSVAQGRWRAMVPGHDGWATGPRMRDPRAVARAAPIRHATGPGNRAGRRGAHGRRSWRSACSRLPQPSGAITGPGAHVPAIRVATETYVDSNAASARRTVTPRTRIRSLVRGCAWIGRRQDAAGRDHPVLTVRRRHRDLHRRDLQERLRSGTPGAPVSGPRRRASGSRSRCARRRAYALAPSIFST